MRKEIMSLRYKMAMSTLKMFSNKEIFKMPYEEMLKNLHVYSRKQKFKVPSGGKCVFGRRRTTDGFQILTMRVRKNAKSERAILFLTNGEYIMDPDESDANVAADIAKASGCDLWMPYVPLLPDYTIRRVYDVVLETYAMLSAEYGEKNVNILGSLSGGGLALGLVPHMNALKNESDSPSGCPAGGQDTTSGSDGTVRIVKPDGRSSSSETTDMDVSDLETPRCIIAVSPTCIPTTDAEREEMSKRSEDDIMIDAGFPAHRLELFCRAADDREVIPAYMLNPSCGDLTGQPPTHICFGGAEVLSALAPAFEDALSKYDIPHTITVEKGMCHGYALMNFFPEGTRAFKEIISYL